MSNCQWDCRHRVNWNSDHICKCGPRSTEEQHISVAGPTEIKLITAGAERITATPIGLQMRKCDGMCIFNTPSVIPSKPKHLAVLRPSPGTVLCLRLLFEKVLIVLDVRIMGPSGERGNDRTRSLRTKLQENTQPAASNCFTSLLIYQGR